MAVPGDASAFGVQASVTVAGLPATVGPVPLATVGDSPKALASLDTAFVDTSVLNTTATKAANGDLAASAAVNNTSIGIGALNVTASVLSSNCSSVEGGQPTGSASLAGLTATIAGVGINLPADPAPNTTIDVRVPPFIGPTVARLILNEQTTAPDGTLTVNALHVVLLDGVLGSLGSGDIIVSQSRCGLFQPVVEIPLATGEGLAVSSVVVAVAGGAGALFFRRARAHRAA